MPLMRRKGGWSWGRTGKIYRGKNARKKALKQGRAIKRSQSKRKGGGGKRKGKYTRIRKVRAGKRYRRT